jgi:hypothetical protein
VNRTFALIALSIVASVAMSLLVTAVVKVVPRFVAREKEVEP